MPTNEHRRRESGAATKRASTKKAAPKKPNTAAGKRASAKRDEARRPADPISAGITEHGWSAVLIPGDDEGPGFGFTVGLSVTHGHPEILVFGVGDVTHATLATMAAAIRAGARYVAGREYEEVLLGYRCKMVRIPRAAYGEYLGTALRHFGGPSFEALQCVWPDARHHFPWDDDVDPRVLSRQPVLAEKGRATWSFGPLEKYRLVLTTRQVASGKEPVREVFHEEDGSWQLLCGTTTDETDALAVCIGSLVDRDPTLRKVGDLPAGWRADRKARGKAFTRARA